MTDYQFGDRIEYKVHYTHFGEEIERHTGTIFAVEDNPPTYRVHRDKGQLFRLPQDDILGPKDIVSKLSV